MAKLNLDKLSHKYNYTKEDAKRSLGWFSEQVRNLSTKVNATSLMSNGKRRRDYFIPGQMYLYYYHPIGIDKLPYFDAFPLVIPFSEDETTFTGINFHYLPTKVRFLLLKNLLDFATDAKMNEKTRLRLQWSYIGGISRYRGVNMAVKKYRKDHVQSQFLMVPADQWFNAIMLPVEQFSSGRGMMPINNNIVWKDSMRFL